MLNEIEEIKNKLDIVEVIGQYVKLQKAGANYKALCPFHKEKTPSFIVSPARQIWHCFGCSTGGDIFAFIMKVENVDFGEALKILARKAGVTLKFEDPVLRSRKQKLINICEVASSFFQDNLKKNKEAVDYLHRRGVGGETIKEFQLGFAPDEWRMLVTFLLNKGFQLNDIIDSGLAIHREDLSEINQQMTNRKLLVNNCYDRFRSRIMFPINDSSGNLVGFSGRIFQGKLPLKTIKNIEETGKYVNSPQTLIFDKSKILYGFYRAREYFHKQHSALIVEGQMDLLASWQANIRNVVATLGTALTSYHFALLKKYISELILSLDTDEAGQKAMERIIEPALANGFEVKVLILPEGKDLADYLLNPVNKSNLADLINKAKPIMEFYFDRALQLGDKDTLDGKKAIVSYFLPKIKKLNNALDKAFWLEKLSQYLAIERQFLEDELNKVSPEGFNQVVDNNEPVVLQIPTASRIDLLAERLAAFWVKNPELQELYLPYYKYFPKEYTDICQLLMKIEKAESLEPNQLKLAGFDDNLISKINQLFLRAEYEMGNLESYGVDLVEEIKEGLKNLKKEVIKKEMAEIELMMKSAEENHNTSKIQELMVKFKELSQELIS